MNKLISSIIATTFLTVFGSYWWYGQTEADKTVRHTITKMGLRGAIKYDGIRFNPLTRNVTVSGVKIIDPKLVDFDLTIGGVTVLNLEREEDFYSRVHFAVSGVKFNALDIARKANRDNSTSVLTQLLAAPAVTLISLGYKEMQTDLEVDYRYALEDAEDSLTIRFAGQDIGDGQASFSVVGMPREWTNAVADLLNGQTGQALQVIGGDLMQNGIKDRVKLTRVEASYNDDNFAERYFNYQKIRERWLQGQELPPDDSASENKRIQESVEKLVDLGFPKDQSIEFVEAVFAFIKDPDEFEFKVELEDKPKQILVGTQNSTQENDSTSDRASFYPLAAHRTWEYQVSFNNGSTKVKFTNLQSRILNGKLVSPQKVDVRNQSNFSFVVDDETGVYEYASQVEGPEPQIHSTPLYYLRYPLQVGTTWSYTKNTTLLRSNEDPLVVPMNATIKSLNEVVTVAAGTFDKCIRIEAEGGISKDLGQIMGKANVTVKHVSFYAPGVGMVKTYIKENGNHLMITGSGEMQWQLESFTK